MNVCTKKKSWWVGGPGPVGGDEVRVNVNKELK